MGRLIDADNLVKCLDKIHEYHVKTIREEVLLLRDIRIINAQPTAYDVDAVVKQLEMKIDNAEFDELLTSNEKDAYVDAYRRAIEIVKGGGVDG